ncbi:membrane hypothetical protein [Bradyrhizobium sp. ORS 375]|uniref:CPBP family intramembrane glutamic endopeptidase n=1 Tax=Bradyrhizobium sp. (strain ORS 375) TaxID=566679 RepID=UPI000240A0FE|nr:CPBP family intramembrane glutamic endopeptidase [Bradyrhizobium sp. ORS 375]CCD90512.1 membrane hypothetical protein [Bradyrhizobium sp. ORS 375]
MREIESPRETPAKAHAVAWLAVVFIPLIASQLLRLHQHEPFGWIAWDYAGRLGALMIAAAIPAARAVAFRAEENQLSGLEIGLWVVGLSFVERFSQPVRLFMTTNFPGTVFGTYPRPSGWLYFFDLVFGLALVALTEEIVFRRCVEHVLRMWLSGRILLVMVSSLLFGGYHWWSGLGNVTTAALLGAGFTLMLQRSVALWPVVLAHYLIDLVEFA